MRGAVSLTPPHELLLAVVPDGTLEALVAGLREQRAALPRRQRRGRRRSSASSPPGRPERRCATASLCELRLLPPRRRCVSPASVAARLARGPRTLDDLDLADTLAARRSRTRRASRARMSRRPRASGIDDGRLWLWEDEAGTPVSLAARTATAAGVGPDRARLHAAGPPPPRLRRRDHCGLHRRRAGPRRRRASSSSPTLANPTSNSIYQQIGFRPIGDRCAVHFTTDTKVEEALRGRRAGRRPRRHGTRRPVAARARRAQPGARAVPPAVRGRAGRGRGRRRG